MVLERNSQITRREFESGKTRTLWKKQGRDKNGTLIFACRVASQTRGSLKEGRKWHVHCVVFPNLHVSTFEPLMCPGLVGILHTVLENNGRLRDTGPSRCSGRPLNGVTSIRDRGTATSISINQ